MPRDARVDAWARLALAQIPPPAIAALLREFATPERVFEASRAQLVAATSTDTAARVQTPVEAALLDDTRRWLDEDGHELIAWDDPDYPRALLEVGETPPVLFFIGRREILNRPALAIVGSVNKVPQAAIIRNFLIGSLLSKTTARQTRHASSGSARRCDWREMLDESTRRSGCNQNRRSRWNQLRSSGAHRALRRRRGA